MSYQGVLVMNYHTLKWPIQVTMPIDWVGEVQTTQNIEGERVFQRLSY